MKKTLLLLSLSFIFNFNVNSQVDILQNNNPTNGTSSNFREGIFTNSPSETPNNLKPNKPTEQNIEKTAYNNCNAAQTLVPGAAQTCFLMNTADNFQAGEGTCLTCNATFTRRSVWFVFQATSNNMTLTTNSDVNYWSGITGTNATSKNGINIYGPFTSNANAIASCVPGSGLVLPPSCYTDQYTYYYDPLFSFSFPTTTGSFYLIQYDQCDKNTYAYYYSACVWLNNTPANNAPNGPTLINACGSTFTGTNIGYSNSLGLPGQQNIDNNTGTTCSGCTPAGTDVPYVINNDSWFRFCATTAGTYNVNFNGISGCINNDGLQMTIFRGTATNLTTVWNAASPSLPGSSQTSPTFSVAAGECIYLMVDGFAGDQCNYSYTLNPVSNPCSIVLSSTLLDIFGYNLNNVNHVTWSTAIEQNTSHFNVLKSMDGINWQNIQTINAAGNSNEKLSYTISDNNYRKVLNYYKIEQVDQDGTTTWDRIVTIDNSENSKKLMNIVDIMGQEVDPLTTKGLVIYMYDDGTTEKKYH